MKNRIASHIDRRPLARVLGFAACAAGLVALLGAGGCNVLTPAAYLAFGPGKVEAEHELDRNRRTVILVDDPQNRVASRRLRAGIAEQAQDLLMRKKKVLEANMIDGRAAIVAATEGTNDDPISVLEIAEILDAEVVVLVTMGEFTLSSNGAGLSPRAVMNVLVFDAEAGEQEWPLGSDGFRLQVDSPIRAGFTPTGSGDTTTLFREQQVLAELAGTALAQVFYTVELTESVRR